MSVDYFYDGLMVIGPQHAGGGKSAYAYAVEGGYIGTEEEFGIRLAALLNGGITATVDTDTNRITLSGTLVPGTYTAYYELTNPNGTKSPVEIGELTLDEETEPTIYTVTFVADGVTVAEYKYAVGDTIEKPAVPAKDGYTGVWETYDISNGGNLTVNAVYTAIEPAAPKDFAENFTVGRFKSDGTIDATTTDATACTDYIGPIEVNDEVMIKGFGTMGDYNSAWYNASKSIYESGKPNAYSGSAMSYAYDSASGVVTIKKVTDNQGYSYLRVGGKLTGTTADVVVNIKRDGEYLTE